MNYRKHYDLLIAKARIRVVPKGVYIERHHIVPRSEGGTNDKSNIVELYPREHFVAHWLLYRESQTVARSYAFNMMSCDRNGTYKPSSRAYAEGVEAAAKACAENQKGRKGIRRDGKVKYVKLHELDFYYEQGWVVGGLQAECNKGRFWSNNGTDQVLSSTILPGWIKGRLTGSLTKGKKAISKAGVVQYVDNPQEWLNQGWTLGNEKYYPGYLHQKRNKNNKYKDYEI